MAGKWLNIHCTGLKQGWYVVECQEDDFGHMVNWRKTVFWDGEKWDDPNTSCFHSIYAFRFIRKVDPLVVSDMLFRLVTGANTEDFATFTELARDGVGNWDRRTLIERFANKNFALGDWETLDGCSTMYCIRNTLKHRLA